MGQGVKTMNYLQVLLLQVIFVSSPSLVYMGHAIYRLRALEKQRHCRKAPLQRELEALDSDLMEACVERELRQLEQGKLNKASLRGSLLCSYIAHIVTRSSVKVGFMLGQHLLYGHHLDPLYRCDHEPCQTQWAVLCHRQQKKACSWYLCRSLQLFHCFSACWKSCTWDTRRWKEEFWIITLMLRTIWMIIVEAKWKRTLWSSQFVWAMHANPSFPQLRLEDACCWKKKQANGPSFPPLISSSSTFLQCGVKRGLEGQNKGKDSVPSPTEHTSSCTHPPDEFKQLETENSTHLTPPTTKSTSCPTSCPSGAAWKLKPISSTVMERNVENVDSCNCSTAMQQDDFSEKHNKHTSKSLWCKLWFTPKPRPLTKSSYRMVGQLCEQQESHRPTDQKMILGKMLSFHV